jgi:hypothetical protein
MGNHVPNFDGMVKEDIAEWYRRQSWNSGEMAAHVFPTRPEGYVLAYNNLITYATLKYRAMAAREKGEIPTSRSLEDECDVLYLKLPEYARW